MSDHAETKVCQFCAETIRAAAKVCPFCQCRQHRFALLKYDLGQIGHGLFFLIASIALMIWVFAETSPDERRSFAPHRQELSVVRTSLEYAPQTPDSWASSLGTNRWNQKWSLPQMEVRFLDAQTNTLEVQLPQVGVLSVDPSLWLTGFITNSGRYSWRVHELEARFLDKQSHLIDVQNLSDYQNALVVGPHREQAFRLPLRSSTFTNIEVVRHVRVQTAVEP